MNLTLPASETYPRTEPSHEVRGFRVPITLDRSRVLRLNGKLWVENMNANSSITLFLDGPDGTKPLDIVGYVGNAPSC